MLGQVPPELGNRFVDREAGLLGRDLEQHAARRAEVDRPEVAPVVCGVVGNPAADRPWRISARSGTEKAT